jgi:hypothetical protein
MGDLLMASRSVAWLVGLFALAPCFAAERWEYDVAVDSMTSKRTLTASLSSSNSLSLNSPYSGPNFGRLFVRQHPVHGVDVAVVIDKGQIICDISNGCNIAVRFDDKPVTTFLAVRPTDYSSTTLFFRGSARFIAAARQAKRILIQMTVFQHGQQVLEFDASAPLTWPIPSTKP